MASGTINVDFFVEEMKGTSTATGTVGPNPPKRVSDYVPISAVSIDGNLVTIVWRVNNGYYYGQLQSTTGTALPSTSFDFLMVWKRRT